MGAAADTLASISAVVRNTDVDWEKLLELNYTTLLQVGASAVDVGANIGRHSRVLVETVKCTRLAMFEPLPELCEPLRRTFGHLPSVTVYPFALGRTNEDRPFYVKTNTLGESGLAKKQFYGDRKLDNISVRTIPVRRLDDLKLDFSPDYVKIDIEGGEMDMLIGGSELIASSRPIISIEYGKNGYAAFGYEAPALYDYAAERHYSVVDLLGNTFSDRDEFLACINRYYWDYLLIPREKEKVCEAALGVIKQRSFPLPLR